MVPHPIQSLLQRLSAMADGWVQTGIIPSIERDLALEKLRRLYEELLSDPSMRRPEASATPEPEEEPESINLDEVLSVGRPGWETPDDRMTADLRPADVPSDVSAVEALQPSSAPTKEARSFESVPVPESVVESYAVKVSAPESEAEPLSGEESASESESPLSGEESDPENARKGGADAGRVPETDRDAGAADVGEPVSSSRNGTDRQASDLQREEGVQASESKSVSAHPEPAASEKNERANRIETPSLFGPEETEALRRHRHRQRILMSLYDMPEAESRTIADSGRTREEGSSYPALRAEATDPAATASAEAFEVGSAENPDIPWDGSVSYDASAGSGPSGAESCSQLLSGGEGGSPIPRPAGTASPAESKEDEPGLEEIECVPAGSARAALSANAASEEAERSGLPDTRRSSPAGPPPQEGEQTRAAASLPATDFRSSSEATASSGQTLAGVEPVSDSARAGGTEAEKYAESAPESHPQKDGAPKGAVLGDVINHDVRTLGDELAASAQVRTPDAGRRERITSLRGAIGLNDRFLLIRDLFGGDAEAYEAAVATLDAFDTFDECLIHIAEHYVWNPNSDGAKLLMELIERKLA